MAGSLTLADEIDVLFIHTSADVFAAWGQWFGGLASTAAVVLALALAFGDRRRREVLRRDDEKRQARQLIIRYRAASSASVVVELHNRSTEPFRGLGILRVSAFTSRYATSDWKWPDKLGPFRDDLDAGESWFSEPVEFEWDGNLAAADVRTAAILVEVTYTDARGIPWVRFSTGDDPRRMIPEVPRLRLSLLWSKADRRERSSQARALAFYNRAH